HRDARGHDSDVGNAHAYRDDDGPRAAMMLLLFMARGLRVCHRVLGPAQCINRAPITPSVFPSRISSAGRPMGRGRESGKGRGTSATIEVVNDASRTESIGSPRRNCLYPRSE